MDVKIDFDTARLEKELAACGRLIPTAAATALTRTAAGSRRDVMEQMKSIFDRPTRFTVNSIRYKPASADSLTASVEISDDAAKGLSPRKYLGPEITGGPRRLKRSEKLLITRGIMRPGQHIVPARGIALDASGNVSGPLMTKILSRLSAFGEVGFSANVSDRTRKRIKGQKLATKRTGTDYFVAHSHIDGEPLGIYQLVGHGHVEPVLYFARANPNYKPRFPFDAMVQGYATKTLGAELTRALSEHLARHTK